MAQGECNVLYVASDGDRTAIVFMSETGSLGRSQIIPGLTPGPGLNWAIELIGSRMGLNPNIPKCVVWDGNPKRGVPLSAQILGRKFGVQVTTSDDKNHLGKRLLLEGEFKPFQVTMRNSNEWGEGRSATFNRPGLEPLEIKDRHTMTITSIRYIITSMRSRRKPTAPLVIDNPIPDQELETNDDGSEFSV